MMMIFGAIVIGILLFIIFGPVMDWLAFSDMRGVPGYTTEPPKDWKIPFPPKDNSV